MYDLADVIEELNSITTLKIPSNIISRALFTVADAVKLANEGSQETDPDAITILFSDIRDELARLKDDIEDLLDERATLRIEFENAQDLADSALLMARQMQEKE